MKKYKTLLSLSDCVLKITNHVGARERRSRKGWNDIINQERIQEKLKEEVFPRGEKSDLQN